MKMTARDWHSLLEGQTPDAGISHQDRNNSLPLEVVIVLPVELEV